MQSLFHNILQCELLHSEITGCAPYMTILDSSTLMDIIQIQE